MTIVRENRLLGSLSTENRELLLRRSTAVNLSIGTPLYEAGETPEFAFFITSGVASIVTEVADGGTAEVGLIGSEGVVGAVHILGPARVPNRAFIQLEATALRIPLADLRSAFRSSIETHDRILEFVQEQSLSLAQIAGCHRLHEAEERLARWLLMAQDRSQSEVLNLTQEFLAIMLGSRRTTVTTIAGTLQRGGLIEYRRGRVRIIDREGLEDTACECYKVTKELYESLYQAPVSL